MATTEGTKLVIEMGRLIWGHPGRQRARTDNNNKPIMKDDGTPAMQWIFGFAVPKEMEVRRMYAGQPNLEELVQRYAFERVVWPVMAAEAQKGYPQGVPSNFAWKYDDGDDTRPVNGGGVPYAQREGYPGHYVITVASSLPNPPPLFKFNPQTGGYDQLTADQIKTGDYGSLALNIACNVPEQRTHTPSLYLNPEGFEFIGYGKEIVSAAAINPMQAFGGRQHALPPGASSVPVSSAPAGLGMPTGQPQMMQQPVGMPQQQPPMMQPGQMQPAPGYAPQQAAMPAPAHDFVQNAGMQMQPAPTYAPQQPGMMPQVPQMQQPVGMPQQQPQMMQPGQMPGMMPQR